MGVICIDYSDRVYTLSRYDVVCYNLTNLVRRYYNMMKDVKVLLFLIGMLIVFGTVGYIEMNETIDWLQISLNASLGFLLMWYGKGAMNESE